MLQLQLGSTKGSTQPSPLAAATANAASLAGLAAHREIIMRIMKQRRQ